MFLIISSKKSFENTKLKTHVYFEAQKPKQYFLQSKLFYENTYKFCVCVYELDHSTN